MDIAETRARNRKQALEREVERLQAEIREIDTFLALYAKFAGPETFTEMAAAIPMAAVLSPTTPPVSQTQNGDLIPSPEQLEHKSADGDLVSQEQFETNVRQVLLDHGRPMQRGRIIAKMRGAGLRIGGRNELKNFGTKIWKARDKFVNLKSEGYWPSDVPNAAVGYIPSVGSIMPMVDIQEK